MNLYRYEVLSDKKEHAEFYGYGILASLEYIFDGDTVINLASFFLDYLDEPNCDMDNTKSYFTEKGNRKFNKAIRDLKKILNEKGFEVITIHERYENLFHKVCYEDKYQVVISTL